VAVVEVTLGDVDAGVLVVAGAVTLGDVDAGVLVSAGAVVVDCFAHPTIIKVAIDRIIKRTKNFFMYPSFVLS
jgi:serine acetyltransferase